MIGKYREWHLLVEAIPVPKVPKWLARFQRNENGFSFSLVYYKKQQAASQQEIYLISEGNGRKIRK